MRNDDEQLAELFSEFTELPAADRAARLGRLRDEAPELARELESLLSAYDASGDFLERLDTQYAADLLRADEELAPPERAGAYRLVREIGRGGLGVVYLGERAGEDFKQLVAVKLIKRGMDSEAILKRFLNERRILASLDHPNIARLIDGGLLDDGRPYFAMEYIEGVPITTWCDRNKATIGQRLKLFEQACRAVQYAHAKLIVHRDLKPGNMLVTPEGQVKLLDFGIAKLLDDDAEGGTALTIAGMHAMTPEYAAPEQILGEPVNTATDVYALGMVLYELLTGHHPYRDGATTREELARAICDTAPTLPSVSVTGERAEAVAAARASIPRLLRRRLNGDLDNIVLKAMAREPERRYGSVEALAEDIHRHLRDEPVMARRETAAYRARLFVRRHRAGMAATGAVMLALAGGMSMALWQAREARSQAAAAAAQAERAEQVSDFLTELFRVNDPAVNRGEQLTARELLERGAERIDSELDGQPDLQAHMAGLIGGIHLNLGEYGHAEPLLDNALAMYQTLNEPLAEAKLLSRRAQLEQRRGEYDTSLNWLDRAEKLAKTTGDQVLLAQLQYERGMAQMLLGEYKAAESSYQDSVRRYEMILGPEAKELANVLNGYGYLVWKLMGRKNDALPLFERAMSLAEQHYDEGHPVTSAVTSQLGWLLSELGEFDRAEALLARELEADARVYGEDHEFYATSLVAFGNFLSDRGRRQEAIEAYRRAYEIYLAELGPRHQYVTYPLNNLAWRYLEAGDYAKALDYGDQCLAIRREILSGQHPDIAAAQHIRGLALVGLDSLPEAQAAFLEALEIRELSLPHDNFQTRETRLELLLVNIVLNGAEGYVDEAAELLASYPEGDEDRGSAAERLQQAGLAIDD